MFGQIALEGRLLFPHFFGGGTRGGRQVVSFAILEENKEFAQRLSEMD